MFQRVLAKNKLINKVLEIVAFNQWDCSMRNKNIVFYLLFEYKYQMIIITGTFEKNVKFQCFTFTV